MAEKTAEHIAIALVDSFNAHYPNWPDLLPGMPASIERQIADEIRAAVEARDDQWSAALHEAFGGRWIDPPQMMGRIADSPAIPEWVGLHVKNAIERAATPTDGEQEE